MDRKPVCLRRKRARAGVCTWSSWPGSWGHGRSSSTRTQHLLSHRVVSPTSWGTRKSFRLCAVPQSSDSGKKNKSGKSKSNYLQQLQITHTCNKSKVAESFPKQNKQAKLKSKISSLQHGLDLPSYNLLCSILPTKAKSSPWTAAC